MKEDYEKVKAMRDAKRKSLRYHWSLWEVTTLRELKKKYWLHPRISAKLLLYTIWTKLWHDQKNESWEEIE